MTNREEFEAWFYSSKYAQVILPRDSDLQIAWEAWQSATKHQEAALRELCLRVAKELVERNQEWIMTNTVREEMDIVESIVDKVLGEQQEIKPRDETQDLSDF